jgi:DNA-binding IclR family transcriptional regulator
MIVADRKGGKHLPLPLTALGKVHMAQFSVKVIRLTGAVLDENQQMLILTQTGASFFTEK